MKVRISLLLLAFLTSGLLAADYGWKDREGNLVPDTASQKSSGKFGASLILVDDEAKFLEAWETPSETVSIDTVSKIERNKILTAVVIFSGCELNSVGGCDIEGGFEVIQPNGETYAQIEPSRVWPPTASPPEGSLVMSQSYLRLRVEPHEPLGNYVIRASLYDLVAGQELLLEATVEAYDPAT